MRQGRAHPARENSSRTVRGHPQYPYTAAVITARRVSRWILTTAAIAAVLVAAVFCWRWWDQSRSGEFGADPRYCELVSAQTIHRLVPDAAAGRAGTGHCVWAAPHELNRSGVLLDAFRNSTPDDARDTFAHSRDDSLWERGTMEDVPGLGDEAFIRFRTPTDTTFSAQVVFRRSNMVVFVDYTRTDKERAKARAGVIDAAGEALDRL